MKEVAIVQKWGKSLAKMTTESRDMRRVANENYLLECAKPSNVEHWMVVKEVIQK